MTEHEQNHRDKLEVSWVVVLGLVFGLFAFGYAVLERRVADLGAVKLDKTVFEEHQRSITAIQNDITRIRDLLEKRQPFFRERE
jgi:hypothetical protein